MPANFIKENFSIVTYILGAVFVIGGAYAEFQYLQSEIENLEEKVEKSDIAIRELQIEVYSLHLQVEYHKGQLSPVSITE